MRRLGTCGVTPVLALLVLGVLCVVAVVTRAVFG